MLQGGEKERVATREEKLLALSRGCLVAGMPCRVRSKVGNFIRARSPPTLAKFTAQRGKTAVVVSAFLLVGYWMPNIDGICTLDPRRTMPISRAATDVPTLKFET